MFMNNLSNVNDFTKSFVSTLHVYGEEERMNSLRGNNVTDNGVL